MSSISFKTDKIFNKKHVPILFLVFIIFLLLIPIFSDSILAHTNPNTVVEVDFIFSNANIFTIDEMNPVVEAIAIKDGLIISLGDTSEVLENYTTTLPENSYDMNGLTIMPGIIDGHTHLIISALGNDSISLEEAQQKALSFGYTTLNEKNADNWLNDTQTLLNAEAAEELILRLNIFPAYNLPILDEFNETIIVENWYPTHGPILDHSRKFRVPGIKIFIDGAYGNRGIAAMSVPYTPELLAIYQSSSLYGDLYFNQTDLNEIVDTIHDKGFSCAFHAMGDRAIETAMNAIEYALNGTVNESDRHQIEHNSFMRGDLIAKAISLNTIHSVRGYFPTYWQDEDEGLYNSTLLEWYANRYSFPGLGIHSYLETDFAWSGYVVDDVTWTRNINPFLHLWGLVTRKAIDENGIIHEPHPWIAEHEVPVQDALRMMTLEGAYAVKQEDYLGSFKIGKYADLIVLTDDPINTDVDLIKDIKVMLTMIDGKIEYQWENPLPTETNSGTPSNQLGNNNWISFIPILLGIVSFYGLSSIRKK